SFASQKPLQHPTSRERIFEMQFVDPAHQGKIAIMRRSFTLSNMICMAEEPMRAGKKVTNAVNSPSGETVSLAETNRVNSRRIPTPPSKQTAKTK
ncbi:hypothetical protein, partial [Martelella sp.]|uniref:hypothetical protein n=1 Tax=Martelella sp. TaxID=1969699 RepID=UPI0025BFFC29